MQVRTIVTAALVAAVSFSAHAQSGAARVPSEAGESRLSNIRQLTFGGQNAEAYWSPDGRWITVQSTLAGMQCDQQYVMRADGADRRRISNGRGKTTCGWFLPGTDRLLFASSHAHDSTCPPRPDPSRGYVWPLDRFDLYTVGRDGSDLRRLTSFDTYTAESVVSPDGKRIVFTSLKDGDLDIYVMNIDGTGLKRLTNTPGYDGGPWWSPDGTKIVYRAHHPADSVQLAQYRALLADRVVRPSQVELFVMNADGSDQRQITRLGGANFGPSWTRDGRRIVFSSNYKNPRSRNFDLFIVDLDGTNLEQITTHGEFDGFPMFSPDGRKLLWASNRNAREQGETNVFVADWKP